MINLTFDEQTEIDEAWKDADGWALSVGTPENLRKRLEDKGLIRFWNERWQLLPVGFSYTRMFEGR